MQDGIDLKRTGQVFFNLDSVKHGEATFRFSIGDDAGYFYEHSLTHNSFSIGQKFFNALILCEFLDIRGFSMQNENPLYLNANPDAK